MIEVRIARPDRTGTRALLRPVGSDIMAMTPAGRRLEIGAGLDLMEYLKRLGELPLGSAAITHAGELPAEFLVHVVVRSREEPVSSTSVRRGLTNGLRRLGEYAVDSVTMLPVGTGAGNLDLEKAAGEMADVLMLHVNSGDPYPSRVVIAVESPYEREVFEREFRRHGVDVVIGAEDVPAGAAEPDPPAT